MQERAKRAAPMTHSLLLGRRTLAERLPELGRQKVGIVAESLLAARHGWCDLPAVRSGRVYFADGMQYFSRPGPRLIDSLEMLAHAIDPTLHPLPAGVPAARRVGAPMAEEIHA